MREAMPLMAGTLGIGLSGLWESSVTTSLENWFALRYLLPLISFVCVGLEGWCFFDLLRKTVGQRARCAVVSLSARDEDEELEVDFEYDVVKDFPRGGFEPTNNQLCIHGLLGIKQAKRSTSSSNPTNIGRYLIIAKPQSEARKKHRREMMAYIAI
ncbi:hypothetical protein F5Y18DRAFT_176438 [Xylariaceae sp. FL1019]|nr:hypothetical protein F5Y18DRAFT_176438 [Xylariaceae sp. FL1019]